MRTRATSSEPLLPEDERNLKGIITPLVTNPSRDLVLISMIVSCSNNNNNNRLDRERRERIITRLVTIANSKESGLICAHLLKYGAATLPELVKVIPVTTPTASRTIKYLIQYDIVEPKGFVERPYRKIKQAGPKVRVFILKGADPQAAIDAQRRHAELRLIKTNTTSDPIRQSQLPEAINLAKIYMDNRGLDIVPDSSVLTPMLKTHGVRVNYSRLLTALTKEGYSA